LLARRAGHSATAQLDHYALRDASVLVHGQSRHAPEPKVGGDPSNLANCLASFARSPGSVNVYTLYNPPDTAKAITHEAAGSDIGEKEGKNGKSLMMESTGRFKSYAFGGITLQRSSLHSR
jgi:hypothetical protein